MKVIHFILFFFSDSEIIEFSVYLDDWSTCNKALPMFLLQMWVPMCLGHRCSDLRYHFGKFLFWWVWSVIPSLFWYLGCSYPSCIGVFLLVLFVWLGLWKDIVWFWFCLEISCFSPSTLIERFVMYSSPSWHLWLSRGSWISVQALLPFRVSVM